MRDELLRTVSTDRQYEYTTRKIIRSMDFPPQHLRLYVQVYSAIVGGTIYLSMDGRITGSLRETYFWLSNGAVSLLAFVVLALVFDSLRSWYQNRLTLVKFGRPKEIPPPEIFFSFKHWGWPGFAEFAIALVIIGSVALFWWKNPFGLPMPTMASMDSI